MHLRNNLLLALTAGLLLTAAWPLNGFAPLLFVAFVPLLWVSYNLKKSGGKSNKIILYAFTAFVVWNGLTTYWIWFSTPWAIAAIFLNSLFQALVYWAFQKSYQTLPKQWGLFTLPVYWIAFEKFHLNWDLSWPWLTLGNGFSEYYKLIQWYEFTGVFGGSLWVLIVNVLLVLGKIRFDEGLRKLSIRYVGMAGILVGLPIALSLYQYTSYTEATSPVNIVVVQPNIDPYNEKFVDGTYDNQTERFINLAKPLMDKTVDYIVGPETALARGVRENNVNDYSEVVALRNLVRQYPRAAVITGASTLRFYPNWDNPPASARKSADGVWYDYFNTALQIDTSQTVNYSHKSKLVPGTEMMPFHGRLGFLEGIVGSQGGASGTLGSDSIKQVFKAASKVAPAICYESIYGEYVGEFINNGAGLIFIITNDGWWGNTPGHRQHYSYAKLRAIESRRSIARSANTGISCFVNQRGDVTQATPYWQPAAIKQTINQNYTLTFYTRFGDYIACICYGLVVVVIGLTVWVGLRVDIQ